jgi:hypothetical protein
MDLADLYAVVLDTVVLGVFLGAAFFLVAFLPAFFVARAARRTRTAGTFLVVRFLLFLALAIYPPSETGSADVTTQSYYSRRCASGGQQIFADAPVAGWAAQTGDLPAMPGLSFASDPAYIWDVARRWR